MKNGQYYYPLRLQTFSGGGKQEIACIDQDGDRVFEITPPEGCTPAEIGQYVNIAINTMNAIMADVTGYMKLGEKV